MPTNPANQIRVVIVSEPGKAGVKRHIVDLLRHLDLSPFQVTLVYSLVRSDAAYPQEIHEIEQAGIECLEIPMDAPLHFGADFKAGWKLLRELRRIKPQVVHLHSSKAGGLGRLACCLVFPRPYVIYTPHAMACYKSRLYLWLERILGLVTSRLVAVSASEKLEFIRWKIPGAREAHALTMGIRLPPVEPRIEHEGDDGRPWRIGACGRICYQKNALLFFQVALAMLKRDSTYNFCWIGDFSDDKEAEAVRELLKQAGSPTQIEVTGWVSNPESYLRTLDTFCNCSRYEGIGYVTAEAQSLRVPAVGTRSAGTVDLITDGETGLLADATVESLVAALTRMRFDSELRRRACNAAEKHIKEVMTVERMAAETEDLYLEGVGQCRR